MSFIQLMWSSYGYGFSQQLRRVRERRGISQQVLADISGVSRSQISNLERNENGIHTMADPQLSTVYKLALALEIPPAVLLPAGGDVVEGPFGGFRRARCRRCRALPAGLYQPAAL